MSKLDKFRFNIPCNSEVIEMNQGPPGQCARMVTPGNETFIMIKDLMDGAKAVELCEGSEMSRHGVVPLPGKVVK